MSEEEYHAIRAEALAADSSVNEFMRKAAKSRIAYQRALRRGKPDDHEPAARSRRGKARTMTTKEIADAWIDNHLPREWKEVLAAYKETPVLPSDVMQWLAEHSPEFKVRMRDELTPFGQRARKESLAHFEEAFIANLSTAVERPG
jgi:hypothetical protein